MTCIVALIAKDGNIFMGGDSAGVAGYSLTVRYDDKVFVRIDAVGILWAFGFTTSFRMGQLIKYKLKLPKIEAEDFGDLHRFMATKFVDAVRSCFHQGGFLQKKDNRESGGTFIVGLLGNIFVIEDDYQVSQPYSYYIAIGSGEDVARGALGALESYELSPYKRIKKALETAELWNTGVRHPFEIVETGPSPIFNDTGETYDDGIAAESENLAELGE